MADARCGLAASRVIIPRDVAWHLNPRCPSHYHAHALSDAVCGGACAFIHASALKTRSTPALGVAPRPRRLQQQWRHGARRGGSCAGHTCESHQGGVRRHWRRRSGTAHLACAGPVCVSPLTATRLRVCYCCDVVTRACRGCCLFLARRARCSKRWSRILDVHWRTSWVASP
jgi:hypothetical protein